jgi:preprotein translocase subunit SecB
MTDKYKILANFIKDMSSETQDIQTYIFVKDNISRYQLNIDIKSKPLKDKLIEVNTSLVFEDKEITERKSHFEITYSSIVKINDDIKEKKDLEKIILCDLQTEIYPRLEKTFLNILHNSGYPSIKFDKKVDFNKLYNERFN